MTPFVRLVSSVPPDFPLPPAFSGLHDDGDCSHKDGNRQNSLKVDWLETPANHVFQVDLPGLKKEDINLLVSKDGVLKISGERTKKLVDPKEVYLAWRLFERNFYGAFEREIRLPECADADGIVAKAEDGVLTVTIPKLKVTEKPESSRPVDVL